ncbi:MAG: family acetyltransferase [Clostridiales bacterium]|nr:family acetyltransferase [Clostridiales bacterium]
MVRKAVEGDIPEILEITREAFKMYSECAGIGGRIPALEETYEDVKKDIETKVVFVAQLDDLVVGSVRVEILPDSIAYLSRFGVGLDYQSHGIGKELMNAVDNAMNQFGVTNLYLHTASRMLSLVRFYYGKGFYIESTTNDRGYIRALLCKEYTIAKVEDSLDIIYEGCAVM